MDMDDNRRARESDDLVEERQEDNEGQLELDLEPEVTPDGNTDTPK